MKIYLKDAQEDATRRSDLRKISRAMTAASFVMDDINIGKVSGIKMTEKAEVLRRVAKVHPWTRSGVNAIARAAIAGGFEIVPHPIYGRNLSSTQLEAGPPKRVANFFFSNATRKYRNIKDFQGFTHKMGYSIAAYVLYGSIGWEYIRNENGKIIGFDVLSGVLTPNVDPGGSFLIPAFYFAPWDAKNEKDVIEFGPNDVFYLFNAGIDNIVSGTSDIEAALVTSVPADIYASTVYRELFANNNSPRYGYWELDPAVSNADMDEFVATLEENLTGVSNFGSSPIVIRGRAEYKQITNRSNDDAPYLEGRKFSTDELLTLIGVSQAKLGVSDATSSKSNLREVRRDFQESTVRATLSPFENALYEQVFCRILDAQQWMLRVKDPSFTTALEDATIRMRDYQNGFLSANEVRVNRLGLPPRKDENGDKYVDQIKMELAEDSVSASDGDIPDGRSDEVPAGDSRDDDPTRPPTDEEYPDSNQNRSINLDLVLDELRKWSKFETNRMRDGSNGRQFVCKYIPQEYENVIRNELKSRADTESIHELFAIAREFFTQ